VDVEIRFEQTEILDAQAVAPTIQKRMTEAHGKLKKLDEEATKRGYKKATGEKAQFGLRQTFRAAKPVSPKPSKGEQGEPVQELQVELSLSALEKANSKDKAAIATITLTAGKNREAYDLLLEAPDGDFANAREFKVENDQVVPAESWWSATRSCLTRNCAAACIGALITCSGTWAAYLACVAVICGGCWARCAACASCDCRWWCRWATGCCDA
jgi:hypothetical protein